MTGLFKYFALCLGIEKDSLGGQSVQRGVLGLARSSESSFSLVRLPHLIVDSQVELACRLSLRLPMLCWLENVPEFPPIVPAECRCLRGLSPSQADAVLCRLLCPLLIRGWCSCRVVLLPCGFPVVMGLFSTGFLLVCIERHRYIDHVITRYCG